MYSDHVLDYTVSPYQIRSFFMEFARSSWIYHLTRVFRDIVGIKALLRLSDSVSNAMCTSYSARNA